MKHVFWIFGVTESESIIYFVKNAKNNADLALKMFQISSALSNS